MTDWQGGSWLLGSSTVIEKNIYLSWHLAIIANEVNLRLDSSQIPFGKYKPFMHRPFFFSFPGHFIKHWSYTVKKHGEDHAKQLIYPNLNSNLFLMIFSWIIDIVILKEAQEVHIMDLSLHKARTSNQKHKANISNSMRKNRKKIKIITKEGNGKEWA